MTNFKTIFSIIEIDEEFGTYFNDLCDAFYGVTAINDVTIHSPPSKS